MQRKLAEIAEIPKILSSTLATVSQTFDKLMPGANTAENNDDRQLQDLQKQHRKFSYDEDAIDYALNIGDDDVDNNDDEADAQNDRFDDAASHGDNNSDSDNSADNENNAIERDLHKLSLKLRDLTPESDYASSVSDNDDDDDDNDDYVDAIGVATNQNAHETDDFLTTTFTWRMRKVPKLFLNGQPTENDSESAETSTESSNDEDEEMAVRLPAPSTVTAEKQQKSVKRGPLELAWPWADRTKIIYKQSTCHLVPRKCGIIEKSKQLLAKQHLFDKNS